MKVCGIYITGQVARIVTLEGTRDEHVRIADDFHSLEIRDSVSQRDLQAFIAALTAHLKENEIQKVGINGRLERGRYSGGATAFRLEGAILASMAPEVVFIFPSTVQATNRREDEKKTQQPGTKALNSAYDLAYECLE